MSHKQSKNKARHRLGQSAKNQLNSLQYPPSVFQQIFDPRENPSLGAASLWARLTARSSGQFMHRKNQIKGSTTLDCSSCRSTIPGTTNEKHVPRLFSPF